MKKPAPPSKIRGSLTTEDKALWDSTAATLDPLKKSKLRVHREVVATIEERPAPGPSPGAARRVATVEVRRNAPDIAGFDKRAARRLRRGHAEIDATVDLHGMRQSEAHAALRRFLMASQARGHRHVLVITGKGTVSRGSDDSALGGDGTHRGVLKRSVPMWLAEPDLRAIVVSFTTAAPQHGGDGALYVHLRKPERGG